MMTRFRSSVLVLLVIAVGLGASALAMQSASDGLPLRGVNLAGAEFHGRGRDGAVHGIGYIYPVPAYAREYRSPEYFAAKGMNVFRLPFLWERVQPVPAQALDALEIERLRTSVRYLVGLGASVIVDAHNYGRHAGRVIGSAELPDSAFADFWGRLAAEFAANDQVIFGLMKEPHDLPTEQWVGAANAAIKAIRAAHAENLILVAGNGWSGAHSWSSSAYGTPNAQALLDISDPAGNVAFEAHQYLDANSSGTSPHCVGIETGEERLRPFTDWLRVHGKKGFLGEFGAGASPTCVGALGRMLAHLHANRDVYLGWAYWAAGPWWGDYFTSLEPAANGSDTPQMRALLPYLQPMPFSR